MNFGFPFKTTIGLIRQAFFSTIASSKMLNVTTILCTTKSNDNYMYLIVDDTTKEAAVVDPLEPDKVLDAVRKQGVSLKSVLTTHHHWDHAGGNAEIAEMFPGIVVYGGDDRVTAQTKQVGHGEKLKIGSLDVECFHTPCHTSGHICYYVTDTNNRKAVFTGDTLFLAGCGKFFEGSAVQMYQNLVEILGSLPDETAVYCGHEYTVSNLKYAKFAEPDNTAIDTKFVWCKTNKCTVPGTIGEEKQHNPFMRVNEKSLQEHAKSTDPVETMKFLRDEKNAFKF